MSKALDDRLSVHVELALTGCRADPVTLARQEDAARRLGLTGAEIDAARRGRAFDAVAARAVALALAIRQGEVAAIESATRQAVQAGLGSAEIDDVSDLTARLAHRDPAPGHDPDEEARWIAGKP